jgi:hypothetical protein
MDLEPCVRSPPAQAPDAAHEVACVEDQRNSALLPLATAVGLAVSVTVGAASLTVTVTACEAVPPVPVHASVYVVVPARAPVEEDPFVARVPDHPPEAVHAVA